MRATRDAKREFQWILPRQVSRPDRRGAWAATGPVTVAPAAAAEMPMPHVAIDPGTPNAGAYALVFGNGVGNAVVAVPEPAARVLMLAGCVGVGWRTRHARQRHAPRIAPIAAQFSTW